MSADSALQDRPLLAVQRHTPDRSDRPLSGGHQLSGQDALPVVQSTAG